MHKLEDLKGLDHKIEYILILVFELLRLATDEVYLLLFSMRKNILETSHHRCILKN